MSEERKTVRLTKAWRDILVRMEKAPRTMGNKERLGARADVLERMREAGLIHSQAPFASAFHTISVTDLGRTALQESEG